MIINIILLSLNSKNWTFYFSLLLKLYILVIKRTNVLIGLRGVTTKYLELTSVSLHFM